MIRCWVCGCPSFTVPVRVNADAVVRFDGVGAVVTDAEPYRADLGVELFDPDSEGPVCVMCGAAAYDDPTLDAADRAVLSRFVHDRLT